MAVLLGEKTQKITDVDKNVEKLERSGIASGNVR